MSGAVGGVKADMEVEQDLDALGQDVLEQDIAYQTVATGLYGHRSLVFRPVLIEIENDQFEKAQAINNFGIRMLMLLYESSFY